MRLKNIRPNFNMLTTGFGEVYFSYETPIAFRAVYGPLIVRENEWGPTTGEHLNYLCEDKKSRISGDKFLDALSLIQE